MRGLQCFGQQLIPITRCPVELYAPAWSYMRVRALAAPAVLVIMVAQVQALCKLHLHLVVDFPECRTQKKRECCLQYGGLGRQIWVIWVTWDVPVLCTRQGHICANEGKCFVSA